MEQAVNIGNFDTRIIIENPIITEGTRGESIINWNYITTVWGSVEYGMISEVQETYGRATDQSITVMVRWRKDISSKARFTIDGTVYYIKRVGVVGRNRFLQIDATTIK